MQTEPRLEDLSAYLDGELSPVESRRLEAHLEVCDVCRRRLAGLRGAVAAVKSLPPEEPPRSFAVPAQHRQRRRAEGWTLAALGAAACLVLALVAGSVLLRPPAGPGAGAGAPGPTSGARGSAPVPKSAGPQFQTGSVPYTNSVSVADPVQPGRRLLLRTNGVAYGRGDTMRVEVVTEGVAAEPSALRLSLERNGYGVLLPVQPVPSLPGQAAGTTAFTGAYPIATLDLGPGAGGSFDLVATWTLPGGGSLLVARLPVDVDR